MRNRLSSVLCEKSLSKCCRHSGRSGAAVAVTVLVLLVPTARPAEPESPADAANSALDVSPDTADAPVRCEELANGDIRLGEVLLHRRTREISFPAAVNLSKGILEVLIATPGGRLHESLLCSPARPLHLQTLLYLLDLHNGPRLPDAEGRQGAILDIDLEWRDADDKPVREPVEQWVLDQRTHEPMQRHGWVFVGSAIADGVFLADAEGNLVITYSPAATVLDIPDVAGNDDTMFIINESKARPREGTALRVILSPRKRGR